MFGAVAKADTDISALIRQSFRAVGRTDDTEVTAFTDGCPGLRSILVDAGITTPPILDWFHIAMRIQHATQTASGLPADDPGRVQAKSVIVEEVERLRWRIWNGKAKNAKRSIDRVRKVMHVYKEERGHNMRSAPSRRLWHALLDVDGYLRGQSSWLVNYAKRYRAGLRVGTSITEGTANFLVNRRMNKSQQMRWSRRGADLLLQVRCAVYNGTLGSGLGHRFQPHANQNEAGRQRGMTPIHSLHSSRRGQVVAIPRIAGWRDGPGRPGLRRRPLLCMMYPADTTAAPRRPQPRLGALGNQRRTAQKPPQHCSENMPCGVVVSIGSVQAAEVRALGLELFDDGEEVAD